MFDGLGSDVHYFHRRSGAPRSTQSWSRTLSHSEGLWGFKINDPNSMHE